MSDFELALALSLQENEPANVMDNDETNPDLHSLFLAFDQLYFQGRLAAVEVRWSPRMTYLSGEDLYLS
jgi:hypothetical protein